MRYNAVCIQSNIHVVDETNPDPGHVEGQIRKNLSRNMELIDYCYLDQRYGPKLVVFSEFCLTAVPESRKVEDYLSRAVPMPGWVTDIIAAKAKQYGIYVACNTFERDDDFPGMVFNTSFIVDPHGKIALKYRKNNNAQFGGAKNTNPGDIYDEYLAKNGGRPEALFPVIDTPIGRLACMTCVDSRWAEVPRMLALNGAEIIVHPTAEHLSGLTEINSWAKRVRALDNMVYLLSCNNGDTLEGKRPINRQWGYSRILDFQGRIIAMARGQGETIVQAEIDLDRLREARAGAGRNPLVASRFQLYVSGYERHETWPLNSFSRQNPYRDGRQMREIARQTLERMYERGMLVRPEADRTTDGRPYVSRYGVACLQTDVRLTDGSDRAPVEAQMHKTLARNCDLIDWLCEEPADRPKLVVLGEAHLTGRPEGGRLEDYLARATPAPGWTTDAYGRKAQEHGIYIAGGVLERDPDGPPEAVFSTGFLIGPDGQLALRYRKHYGSQTGTSLITTPGDVYDAYVERYGEEALFPVVDTELGRIGLMVGEDLQFAEVARMLALNGAELILHPTSEAWTGAWSGVEDESWQLAKHARAWDNACYVVSTNTGELIGGRGPRNRQRAGSTRIVGFDGEALAVCGATGESVIQAEIDLRALRRERAIPSRNMVVVSRFRTYVPMYRTVESWPINTFLHSPLRERQQVLEIGQRALEETYARGMLVRPSRPAAVLPSGSA